MAQLSDSISIRNLQVRNRLVMPPMVMHLATEDGHVTEKNIRHYEARSRGGVGLIVIEASAVNWEHRISQRNIGIHADSCTEGLSRIVKAIHAHGAKTFIQLCHAGPNSSVAKTPLGPSAVGRGERVPTEASNEQIEAVKLEFVRAANRAKDAGFDGVEIHAAHFFLLSSFISPSTNKRKDAYGGTTVKRTKLTADITKMIRKELGDYPIQCRMNGIENVVNGVDIKEAIAVAKLLERAGVDSLSISGSLLPDNTPKELVRFTSKTLPDFMNGYPYGCFVPCAAEIKRHVSVPVIGVGQVRTAGLARGLLQNDLCDLIAIGRGMLADPEFAAKALAGQDDKIVPWKE